MNTMISQTIKHNHIRSGMRITVLPIQWLAAVFSFETSFLLFLFAGRFKADPRFAFIKFDLTLFFMLCCLFCGGLVCLRKGYRIPNKASDFLIASLLFFGYILCSYLWSNGEVYAWEKLQYVGILTVFSLFVFTMIISSSRERVMRFLTLLIAFGIWLAIERLLSLRQSNFVNQEYIIGGNYIGLGRVLGMAALVALVFGLKMSSDFFERNQYYLCVGLFVVVLLLNGSRMPAVAAVIAAFCIPLVWRKNSIPGQGKKYRCSILIMASICLISGYFIWKHVGDQGEFKTLRRLELLVSGSDLGASGESRRELWMASYDMWLESPVFGHGLGAFPLLFYNQDYRSYPHNLILELAVETGIVGLLLLVLLLGVAIKNFYKTALQKDPLGCVIAVLIINGFLNALVSGDLSDNRHFFGMLGLTCLHGK